MVHAEEIEKIMDAEDGYLRIRSVETAGIARAYAYQYLTAHPEIKKAAKGVYVRPDTERDRMYLISLRNKDAVFSHFSAAFLLGMTDSEPYTIMVTVPVGYNANHLKEQFVKPVFVDRENAYLGRTLAITRFGPEVPTFNEERTICDLMRKRRQLNQDWYRKIIQDYFRREKKDLDRLREYAKIFHISKLLDEYLILIDQN